jgi:enoyl-CoA hydratase
MNEPAEVAYPDSSPGVRVEPLEGFARVRIDRPPVNAFTAEMFERFHQFMLQLGDDPKPVLVTGVGSMFSAGFDINQPDLNADRTTELARNCLAAIRDHPAPVVAAVEGAAVGIGLLIAMSADILVVSRSARLRMPEVLLGIDSDVTPLRRFLPDPWIRRMCLVGETFTPTELRLDCWAGAIVCEPGASEQAASAVLESLVRIDAAFLGRAKQNLARSLFNVSVDNNRSRQ